MNRTPTREIAYIARVGGDELRTSNGVSQTVPISPEVAIGSISAAGSGQID